MISSKCIPSKQEILSSISSSHIKLESFGTETHKQYDPDLDGASIPPCNPSIPFLPHQEWPGQINTHMREYWTGHSQPGWQHCHLQALQQLGQVPAPHTGPLDQLQKGIWCAHINVDVKLVCKNTCSGFVRFSQFRGLNNYCPPNQSYNPLFKLISGFRLD